MSTFRPSADGGSLLRRLQKQRAAQQQDIRTRAAVNKANRPPASHPGTRALKLNPTQRMNPKPLPGSPVPRPKSHIEKAREATEAKVAAGEPVGRGNWDD